MAAKIIHYKGRRVFFSKKGGYCKMKCDGGWPHRSEVLMNIENVMASWP